MISKKMAPFDTMTKLILKKQTMVHGRSTLGKMGLTFKTKVDIGKQNLKKI